jgi:hypothetical protein
MTAARAKAPTLAWLVTATPRHDMLALPQS